MEKTNNQARPSPWKEQANKEWKIRKTVHTIRGQGWVAKCTNEPLDHGKRMAVDKLLTYTGSGARARPKHYQLIPSQYRSGGLWIKRKRGYGLAVGKREKSILGFRSDSFEGDVLLGWHTIQKKVGWVGTTRCMPWEIARENTHTMMDKNATVNKQTKQSSLFGNGEWHNQHR